MADSNPYRRDDDGGYGEPEAPSYAGDERKGPGCLFWGCLGVVGLFFLCIFGAIGGGYYWTKSMVAKWTDSTPVELTHVAYSDEEIESLKDRLDAFREANERGEATGDFELTADDINALVNDVHEFTSVDTPAYVEIEGDQIYGEVSVPLEELAPWPMFKGRYFNGSATVTAELINGELVVKVQSVEVNGQSPPQNIMNEIMNEDLFDDHEQSPKVRRFIENLESVEVKDGRIILKLKQGKPADGPEDSAAEAEPESTEPESSDAEPQEEAEEAN